MLKARIRVTRLVTPPPLNLRVVSQSKSLFRYAFKLTLPICHPRFLTCVRNDKDRRVVERNDPGDTVVGKMKAQDAELTAQVAKMNKAPKNEKVTLMAAVLTSMVEQRTAAMHARMKKMQGKMMQHMQRGKDSMMKCPMMQGMEEQSGEVHKRY